MRTIGLAVLALALAGCRTAPTGSMAEERASIEQAIVAREAQYRHALDTRDAEVLTRLHSFDSYVLRSDDTVLRKEHMLQYYEAYLATNPVIDVTTEYIDVAASLDMAYEVGHYVEEYDDAAARVRVHAKYLNVWKKIGGSWRLAAEADVYDARTDRLYGFDPAARADSARVRADSARAAAERARPDGMHDDPPPPREPPQE